jgi:ubiquinone/menaquinone biosynthesis C-methylase UbiE
MHCDENRTPGRVCPASHAWFLTARSRRLLHNPAKILRGLISEGQMAVDLGCGPGHFTLDMARMVGDTGCVVAVDLQQQMLGVLLKRARAAGLESRIRLCKCESDKIGLDTPTDFALAFYVVHEVPDQEAFLREAHSMLKPGGRLLLVEPKMEVSKTAFEQTLRTAYGVDFRAVGVPRVALSRSALLER